MGGDAVGEVVVDAAGAEGGGEFGLFAGGVAGEFAAFEVDFGVDEFVLGADGDVFAGGHGQGAGDEAGDAGEGDGVGVGAAGADAADEGDVGDEAVHGAEDGGA